MAEDTIITPLNFNNSIVGKTIVDKKTGVEVQFGYVSGLPGRYADLLIETRGLAIALQDSGISQELLDRTCQKLIGDCKNESLETLVTKGDFPFDNRWYIIGDFINLFEAARKDKLKIPISDFLWDDVLEELN